MSFLACIRPVIESFHLSAHDVAALVGLNRETWRERAYYYYVLSSLYFPQLHAALAMPAAFPINSNHERDVAVGRFCMLKTPYHRTRIVLGGVNLTLSSVALDRSRVAVVANGSPCVFVDDNVSNVLRGVHLRLVSERTIKYSLFPHRLGVATYSGNGDGKVYFAHGYRMRGGDMFVPQHSIGVLELNSVKSDDVYWKVSYLKQSFVGSSGEFESSVINKYDFLVVPCSDSASIRIVDCAYCRDMLLRHRFYIQSRVCSTETTITESDSYPSVSSDDSFREFHICHGGVRGIQAAGHRIFCVGSTLVLLYYDFAVESLRVYAADVEAFVFEEVLCSGDRPVFEVVDSSSEFNPKLCQSIGDFIAVVHSVTRRVHMLHVCRPPSGYCFHWHSMRSVDFNRRTSVLVGCYVHGMNLNVLEYNTATGANLKHHVLTLAPAMDSSVVYDMKMMDSDAINWLSDLMTIYELNPIWVDARVRIRRVVRIDADGGVDVCNTLEVLVPPDGLIYGEPDASDYRVLLTASDAGIAGRSVDEYLPLNDGRNFRLHVARTLGSADLVAWFVQCELGVPSPWDGDQFLHMYFRMCNG